MEDDMAVIPPAVPYCGEIASAEMSRLLTAARARGWREAITALPAGMRHNIANAERAGFQDVLPVSRGARILDVGAGLGCIAAELAGHYEVVALEGVRQRAEFIALRRRQDDLRNLMVLNADLNAVRFADSQFDAIVLNGVLEWAGLFDTTAPPGVVQQRLLAKIRRALKPSGFVYIGIENRIGWDQFLGAVDHSGLKYTSLLPRFAADWVCKRGPGYRGAKTSSYRTYTYSYYGYRHLFNRSGLKIHAFWVAPLGYNLPAQMVPVNRSAIQTYVAWHWIHARTRWWVVPRNTAKRALASPFFWRLFGSDFVFLLRRDDA